MQLKRLARILNLDPEQQRGRGPGLMKPITQTCLGQSTGNCLTACLASIMEVRIDEAPQAYVGDGSGFNEDDLVAHWERTLMQRMAAMGWDWTMWPSALAAETLEVDEYCVLGGKSPRGDYGHAVVGQWTKDGMLVVHDPHPEGGGLDGGFTCFDTVRRRECLPSIMVACFGDDYYRSSELIPHDAEVMSSLLFATRIDDAFWDEHVANRSDQDFSCLLGYGSEGVGACSCYDSHEIQNGCQDDVFETIADALDILVPGRYPVYSMHGDVLDWFEVREDAA